MPTTFRNVRSDCRLFSSTSRTAPELASLALMGQPSEKDFLCIGRNQSGEPVAVVVAAHEFLAWLDSHEVNRGRMS